RRYSNPYVVPSGVTDSTVRGWSIRHELELTESFVQINPADGVGHLLYGRALLNAGRFDDAERELVKGSGFSTLVNVRREYYRDRVMAALGAERPRQARALIDSMLTDYSAAWQSQLAVPFGLMHADSGRSFSQVGTRDRHIYNQIYAGIVPETDYAVM